MKQRKTKRESAEELIQQDRLEAMEGKLRSARENQELAIEILELLNQRVVKSDVIERIAELVRSSTGIEAVGVRLREGDDFPYLVAIGFPDDFIKAENSLCSRNGSGEIVRDSEGNPVLGVHVWGNNPGKDRPFHAIHYGRRKFLDRLVGPN